MGLICFEHYTILEKKRIELLASLIDGTMERTCPLLREITEISRGESPGQFDEPGQKTLRQIHQILKKWENCVGEKDRKVLRRHQKEIGKILSSAARVQIKNVKQVSFHEFFEKAELSEPIYRLILGNVISLQITTGCSNCCRRCNEWALPGVRKHFSFHAVKKILGDLFAAGNNAFACYGSSDPLDWRDGDKTILDIARFLHEKNHRPAYGLLTKIPKGSEDILMKLTENGVDFSVSVTAKNKEQVRALEERAGRSFDLQHDTDDLLIPAGLDEDFATVKSSITDVYGVEITPDGVFAIIPTFTSALHPTGQCRIRIDKDTVFVPKKITGHHALSRDYFAILEVINMEEGQKTLNALIKPQVENILLCSDDNQVTPPGMMNMEEFFKSLEHDAVIKRGQLYPVVLKSLRSAYLNKISSASGQDKELSDIKAAFKQDILACKARSNPDAMPRIRLEEFSKLLGYVSEYAELFPHETSIIRHLRQHDQERYKEAYQAWDTGEQNLEDRIKSTTTGLFTIFQILVFRLLENPGDPEIKDILMNADS